MGRKLTLRYKFVVFLNHVPVLYSVVKKSLKNREK